MSRALRRAAGQQSRLVHVFAQPSESGSGRWVDLILFVVADGVEAAEGYAATLLRGVLAECDTGLELVRCAVELFLPAAEAQLGGEM
ncbi:hypothetical protein [Streptacidiphilus monticola]|uniref:Uncharacterized protein n=1 Tax=Streptacidiphilus monticola TaxID=2161674 RepID=A0ABW1G571_9ACTN